MLEWMTEGACRPPRDAALWDTDIPGITPGDRGAYTAAKARHRTAKGICKSVCPVQVACLEYALQNPGATDAGIWGGTDPKERAKLRLRRRKVTK